LPISLVSVLAAASKLPPNQPTSRARLPVS
jgi:hypothetical protein